VNRNDPIIIEIWNLVFMQFNCKVGGAFKLLSVKYIDTGMVLERITSILQNVKSNYNTDIFSLLFDKIQNVTGFRHYSGKIELKI
jgi:alanyl-tRNA synthetase